MKILTRRPHHERRILQLPAQSEHGKTQETDEPSGLLHTKKDIYLAGTSSNIESDICNQDKALLGNHRSSAEHPYLHHIIVSFLPLHLHDFIIDIFNRVFQLASIISGVIDRALCASKQLFTT